VSDTWARRAPLTGIAAVVLFVVAFILTGETPDFDAPTREIIDFYDNTAAQLIGSLLVFLGCILFVFFAASLRSALREAEALSTLVLVGGAIFAVGLTIFAAINFTLADLVDSDNVNRIDPGALQALNAMNSDFFFPGTLGVSVFYFSAALALLGTSVFPRWLGWVTVVLAVVSILGPGGFFAFLALGPWTIVASVILLAGSRDASPGPGPEQPLG
jgi:hypothetical protein